MTKRYITKKLYKQYNKIMSTTKTITVPEQWSEVKYKDYYRFVKSIEGQEEDNKAVMEMALQYLCNLDVAD